MKTLSIIHNLSFKLKNNTWLKHTEDCITIIYGYRKFDLNYVDANSIALLKVMVNSYVPLARIKQCMLKDNVIQLINLDIFEYALSWSDDQIIFNLLPGDTNYFHEETKFVIDKYIYSYIDVEFMTYNSPINRYFIKSKNMLLSIIFSMLMSETKFIDLYHHLKKFYSEIDHTLLCFILNVLQEMQMVRLSVEEKSHLYNDIHRWEFHDLLFHMKSRIGFHDNPIGRTYPFKDVEPPYPAQRDIDELKYKEIIPLIRPEPDELRVNLDHVLQLRQSGRVYANNPITINKLASLLYHSHAVRKNIPQGNNQLYESSKRNYPSSGGTYSLEVYLIVNKCEGLNMGIYYYCPYKHVLYSIDYCTSDYNKLMLDAKYANGSHQLPDILLIISSRFGRVNWKYQTMAYSSILKDVGVLYMTMYCVATALKIGVCALGCGDILAFENVIKRGIFQESSVGEIIIGNIR